jgi:hypothetical protein
MPNADSFLSPQELKNLAQQLLNNIGGGKDSPPWKFLKDLNCRMD